MNRPARQRVSGDLRDNSLLSCTPIASVIDQSAGLLEDLADMRFAGDIVFRQIPKRQIGRIVEL